MALQPGQQLVDVRVWVRNIGLADAACLTATLSFTGSMDRTPEYTVTPFAGNPTLLRPGDIAPLHFSIDVSAAATLEAITVDASAMADDAFSGLPVTDPDADRTGAWSVVATLQPDL